MRFSNGGERRTVVAGVVVAIIAVACSGGTGSDEIARTTAATPAAGNRVATIPGMSPVPDATNLYSETARDCSTFG